MKYKEIKKMNDDEREKKLRELKIELLKSKTNATKTGNANPKEIRKTIAKILTFNSSNRGIETK